MSEAESGEKLVNEVEFRGVDWIDGVEFDLNAFTTNEYRAHMKIVVGATVDESFDHWSGWFTKVIKKLPKAWGDPGKVDTYGAISYLHFDQLIAMFNDALDIQRKKVRRMLT